MPRRGGGVAAAAATSSHKHYVADEAGLPRSAFPWVIYQDAANVAYDELEQEASDVITPVEIVRKYGIPEPAFRRYLQKEVSEATACFSLPFSVLMVVAYTGAMVMHLGSPYKRAIEHSIEVNVIDNANFAFSDDDGTMGFRDRTDVDSISGFWSWLIQGYVPVVFAQSHEWSEGLDETELDPLSGPWNSSKLWYNGGRRGTPKASNNSSQVAANLSVDEVDVAGSSAESAGNDSFEGSGSGVTVGAKASADASANDSANLSANDSANVSNGSNGSADAMGDAAASASDEGPSERDFPRNERGYIMVHSRVIGGVRLRQERSASTGPQSAGGCWTMAPLQEFFGLGCVGGHDYELRPEVWQSRYMANPQREEWLYIHDDESVISQQLVDLEAGKWIDRHTKKVEVCLAMFNAEHAMYSLTMVNFFFARGGRVWQNVASGEVSADLYNIGSSALTYMYDIAWLLCLAWILMSEAREIWDVLRLYGCRGIITQYVGFWNFVDWLSVIGGIAIISAAASHATSVTGLNNLMAALAALDEGSNRDLYRQRARDLVDRLYMEIMQDHKNRALFAAYPIVIGLRLLKSFAGQPKLNILTKTLYNAAVELAHFVFAVAPICLMFAVCGVLLFGRDVEHFVSLTRSGMTIFRMVFGEHNWENIVVVGRIEAFTWYFLLIMIIIFLLLNILIAIILASYADVKAEHDKHNETLWTEVRQSYTRWVGHARGELVPFSSVLEVVVGLRQKLPILYRASAPTPNDFLIKPLMTNDHRGTLRLVNVDWLRTNVEMMRMQQAKEMLIEAVMLYYEDNKEELDEQMMLSSVKLQLMETAAELRFARRLLERDHPDVSVLGDDENDDEKGADDDLLDDDGEADDASRVLATLRIALKGELSNARLHLDSAHHDDSSSSDESDDGDAGDVSATVVDEAGDFIKRRDELSARETELHLELEAGHRTLTESLTVLSELEGQLLHATSGSARAQGRQRLLSQHLSRIEGIQQGVDGDDRRARAQVEASKAVRDQGYNDVRILSAENQEMRSKISRLQAVSSSMEKRRAREVGTLARSVAHLELELAGERRRAQQRTGIREHGFAELSAWLQTLEDSEEVQRLRRSGATRPIEATLLQDLSAARDILLARQQHAGVSAVAAALAGTSGVNGAGRAGGLEETAGNGTSETASEK